MRAILGFYLMIGIVLLLLGFFATGPCTNKNNDIVSDVVFVLAWPVFLYGDVIERGMTPEEWLHRQFCEGPVQRTEPAPPR